MWFYLLSLAAVVLWIRVLYSLVVYNWPDDPTIVVLRLWVLIYNRACTILGKFPRAPYSVYLWIFSRRILLLYGLCRPTTKNNNAISQFATRQTNGEQSHSTLLFARSVGRTRLWKNSVRRIFRKCSGLLDDRRPRSSGYQWFPTAFCRTNSSSYRSVSQASWRNCNFSTIIAKIKPFDRARQTAFYQLYGTLLLSFFFLP